MTVGTDGTAKAKSALDTQIDAAIYPNTAGEIDADHHNSALKDLNASVFNKNTDDSDDIREGSNKLFFTDARVQALLPVGALFATDTVDVAATATIAAVDTHIQKKVKINGSTSVTYTVAANLGSGDDYIAVWNNMTGGYNVTIDIAGRTNGDPVVRPGRIAVLTKNKGDDTTWQVNIIDVQQVATVGDLIWDSASLTTISGSAGQSILRDWVGKVIPVQGTPGPGNSNTINARRPASTSAISPNLNDRFAFLNVGDVDLRILATYEDGSFHNFFFDRRSYVEFVWLGSGWVVVGEYHVNGHDEWDAQTTYTRTEIVLRINGDVVNGYKALQNISYTSGRDNDPPETATDSAGDKVWQLIFTNDYNSLQNRPSGGGSSLNAAGLLALLSAGNNVTIRLDPDDNTKVQISASGTGGGGTPYATPSVSNFAITGYDPASQAAQTISVEYHVNNANNVDGNTLQLQTSTDGSTFTDVANGTVTKGSTSGSVTLTTTLSEGDSIYFRLSFTDTQTPAQTHTSAALQFTRSQEHEMFYWGAQNNNSFASYDTSTAADSAPVNDAGGQVTLDMTPPNTHFAYFAYPSNVTITELIGSLGADELSAWPEQTNAFTVGTQQYNVRTNQNNAGVQIDLRYVMRYTVS